MAKGCKIDISPGAFLWTAVLLMFLPIQWVAAMLLAGASHEFCHVAALSFLDVPIERISIGMRGAVIKTGMMHPKVELLCALAGPLGSACLVLFVPVFPRLAICGGVHCLYNLLPLMPFDGGRVLRCLISLIFLLPRDNQKEKLLANGAFWRYNRKTNAKGYQYDRTEAEDPPQRTEACTLHRRRIS